MQLYVLDDALNPIPIGVKGELYVGGIGVGRGYLNDAEKTVRSFVPNPFSENQTEKMYKTGDLVRYHENGELEFLSRVDNQIKIRGFRIELGEIESRLSKHPDVADVAVKCFSVSESNKHLVGYVTCKNSNKPSVNHLRRFLLEALPDYMVPSLFMIMEKMPLTHNGKLNRKALPDPQIEELMATDEYIPPTTITEKNLVIIWSNILKLDPQYLGIHHNFFELGGDSIISIQMVAAAKKREIYITPRQIFEHQTIAKLSSAADKNTPHHVMAEQGLVKGFIPLTPIQHWLLHTQQGAFPHHYNQSIAITILNLNKTVFEKAIQDLFVHHDMLRVRVYFDTKKQRWQQYLCDISEITDCYNITEEKTDSQLQAELNLETGLIMNIGISTIGNRKSRIILALHHWVTDGISSRILLEDLYQLYTGLKLPEKTTSFKYWATSLSQYAKSDSLKEEINYWNEQSSQQKMLRADTSSVYLQRHTKTITQVLNKELTEQLIKQVPEVYKTHINDILLTALALTFDHDQYCVDLEGHGREDIFDDCDISRTVGWFTCIFPIKLILPDGYDIEQAILSIKTQLRKIPKKGIGYGVLRYLANNETLYSQQLGFRREKNRNEHRSVQIVHEDASKIFDKAENSSAQSIHESNEPTILFNYLGQFNSSSEGFELSDISPVGDRSDEIKHPYFLQINSAIIRDELILRFSYDKSLTDTKTIQDFSYQYLNNLRKIIAFCQENQAKKIDAIYSLSPLQEGILYHKLANPASNEYFIQIYFKLPSDVNVHYLKKAWERVIDQYAALRTGFIHDSLNKPRQYVMKEVSIAWKTLDWSKTSLSEQKFNRYLLEDRSKGFDLKEPSLIRFSVMKLPDDSYKFLWSHHHIILDGWSLPIIMNAVDNAYQCISKNQPFFSAKIKPYEVYIDWLNQQNILEAKHYWQLLLQDFEAPNTITTHSASPNYHAATSAHERKTLSLSHALTRNIQRFAQHNKLTLNTIVQGVWGMLLSLYCGQEDIVFGATVSGRPAQLDDVEQMIGLFINTLPVRAHLDPNISILHYLSTLQQQGLASRDYEYVSLADIQTWCHFSQKNLFETLMIFENYPENNTRNAALKMSDFGAVERTNYPLTVFAYARDQLCLTLDYDVNQFTTDVIDGMLNNLHKIFQQILQYPDMSLMHLPAIVSDSDCILGEIINDDVDELTVHRLFELQVYQTPQAIAAEHHQKTICYAELNIKANQLAHYLIANGAGNNIPVGIYMKNSLELFIGLLAILKAGSAYLPLDPNYPEDRLRYMLTNSQTTIIIGKEIPLWMRQKTVDINCFNFSDYSKDNPSIDVSTHDLAYIIYTSGTTGLPKGVLIEHKSVVHFLHGINHAIPIQATDKMLLHTPLSFDISGLEIFLPLTNGASIIVLDNEDRNQADKVLDVIAEKQVTIMQATPTGWRMLIEENSTVKLPQTLLCGGEALSSTLAQALIKRSERVFNVYGPTETTIWASAYPVQDAAPIVLGKPLAGITFFVLAASGKNVPIGGIGELCIGGNCLARGYLGLDALTDQRFIQHTLNNGDVIRLYKTGDWVKRMSHHDLIFIGRIDEQVKIRGYRIELSEIEVCLLKNEAIQHCVVTVILDGHQQPQLVAYYVANTDISTRILRDYLKLTLPAHMIPAVFIWLPHIPLTPSGKLDRKALPKPDGVKQKMMIAPRNENEQTITDIFARLFQLNPHNISIEDDFFSLGGHSLYAARMISAINHTFNLNWPIRTIFDYPRIADLAEKLAATQSSLESITL